MPGSTLIPELGGAPFLIDGGLETCLIFHDGFELPSFASFTLLDDGRGRDGLTAYYKRFADIARHHGSGFVFDAPTWRASPEWGKTLGYDRAALARANIAAATLIRGLADAEQGLATVVNAPIGPRGDGYNPDALMTGEQARDYHRWQVETLAKAGVDMVSALTMTHVGEAEGIALAAAEAGLPVVVSFTVETDGRLPTGMPLAEAVARVDDRCGDDVRFYMVNCAHPSHFADVLAADAALAARIGGIRANASRMSHAELDEAEELDAGDPAELARDYRTLAESLPGLCLLGGCCGTDHRHIGAIADACLPVLDARR